MSDWPKADQERRRILRDMMRLTKDWVSYPDLLRQAIRRAEVYGYRDLVVRYRRELGKIQPD